MSLTKESTLTQKLYNNYTVGIISMIVAIFLPVVLPILGDFISPFLFLAGILAISISKVSWLVKIISIVIPIAIIVIFWNEYLSWILKFS